MSDRRDKLVGLAIWWAFLMSLAAVISWYSSLFDGW